jgi:hypothetical protein
MRAAPFLISFLTALAVHAAASAGELVVTKSTVPGLDPGTIVDGADKLSLRAGHRLSLIAPTGKVINLVGPYEGVPDATAGGPREEKLVTTIATLMSGHGRDASQLGATRNAAARRGKQVWVIEVGTPGAHCVQQGKPLVLWQAGRTAPGPLALSRTGSTEKAAIDWPKGEAMTAWPAGVAVMDGAGYSLGGVAITLHVLPAALTNPAEQAAALAEKGCDVQAMALLGTAG